MTTPDPINDAPLPAAVCTACGGTGRLPGGPFVNDWWPGDFSPAVPDGPRTDRMEDGAIYFDRSTNRRRVYRDPNIRRSMLRNVWLQITDGWR